MVEDKHDPFNVNKIGRDLSDEESEDHLTTPMVPQHENNGFIRFMPELIQEMNRRGVRFNFGGNGQILVDGFYKNGPLTLDIKGDLIIATDKRGKSKTITELQDLVTLNFSWWKRSSSRGVYLVPERPWLDEFVKTNIVKRQVIYVPKDDEAVE